MTEGFEHTAIAVGTATVAVWEGGEGTPVLLLHSFPQTHEAWRRVAPALTSDHTVVCADLPGYGDSRVAESSPVLMSKRSTAAMLADVMASFGHERFAVIGHDRGALIALRLALDYQDRITHLGVMDVIRPSTCGSTCPASVGSSPSTSSCSPNNQTCPSG
jgi:haloacetate dehalogenase